MVSPCFTSMPPMPPFPTLPSLEKNWGKAPRPGNAWILAGLDEGNGGLVYQPPMGKWQWHLLFVHYTFPKTCSLPSWRNLKVFEWPEQTVERVQVRKCQNFFLKKLKIQNLKISTGHESLTDFGLLRFSSV